MSNAPVSNLESPQIEACYSIIADFFSAYSLPSARKNLNKLLFAALNDKATKLPPSNVIYFLELIQKLVIAALYIQKTGFKRQSAILQPQKDKSPDLNRFNEYCGWQKKYTPWNYFPRSLTIREYNNPYKVFQRVAGFGGKKKWVNVFIEFRDYCFFNSSYQETCIELNILQLQRLLNKLLDAAHLLEVRAIVEINGELRPKWKDPFEIPSQGKQNKSTEHNSYTDKSVQHEKE